MAKRFYLGSYGNKSLNVVRDARISAPLEGGIEVWADEETGALHAEHRTNRQLMGHAVTGRPTKENLAQASLLRQALLDSGFPARTEVAIEHEKATVSGSVHWSNLVLLFHADMEQ